MYSYRKQSFLNVLFILLSLEQLSKGDLHLCFLHFLSIFKYNSDEGRRVCARVHVLVA